MDERVWGPSDAVPSYGPGDAQTVSFAAEERRQHVTGMQYGFVGMDTDWADWQVQALRLLAADGVRFEPRSAWRTDLGL